MKKESGFTVVELMIVVSIIAVLSAAASLSYLTMRPNLRLSGSSRQILGDLLEARIKAVNQNNHYKVIFLNDQQYQILDDDDGDGIVDAGESSETKNIQDNYPGVTLSATADPSFSSKGTASTLATVTVTNTSGSKSITVRATGQVKIN